MNRQCNAPGYILVLTLIIVSMAVVMVSFVVTRVVIYAPVARTALARQRALMLAHGGVQLACSQLAYADVSAEEEKAVDQTQTGTGQKQQGNVGVLTFLKTIRPHLNAWQSVLLNAQKDGVNGKISMYLTAEEGKININTLYDFEKHAFVQLKKAAPEMPAPDKDKKDAAAPASAKKPEAPKKEAAENETEKLFDAIFANVQKTMGGEKLFDAFATFLKNRQDILRDVTELLKIEEFAVFKDALYHDVHEEKAPGKEQPRVVLTDLFTLWSGVRTLDPLCLSSAAGAACGFEVGSESTKEAQSKLGESLKQFTGAYNWPSDWDKYFKALYNKELSALPAGLKDLLATRFEPKVFAVTVCATVGQVTERVYALLVRSRPPRESKQPARVSVVKVYRI